MNRVSWSALFTAAAATAWFATAALPWPARAFTVFLAVPLPALAVLQLRTLAGLELAEMPRLPIYLSSAVTLWLLAIISVLAAQYSDFTPGLLGFRMVPWPIFVAWMVVGMGGALLLFAVGKLLGKEESPLLLQLLPQSRREQAAFVGLSLTAGICEEIVFRGFLIAALTVSTGSIAVAVALSSSLFGVLHAYQSVFGTLRATLLGAALALPFVLAGSILPGIAAHAAIDIIGGLWVLRRAV